MEQKRNWLKRRRIVAGFGMAALIGGFLFLSPSITGGSILESSDSFNPLSLIGLVLIGCAIVLAAYSLKKK